MNLLDKYKLLKESKTTSYESGTKFTAKVYKNKDGTHVAKFFKDGQHMVDADYQHKDPKEVHEFAQEEMEFRKKEAKKVNERILEPQGHKESPDPITKDSDAHTGHKKKMMGNKTPLEVISKILAGR
jgi:hypothetical protein